MEKQRQFNALKLKTYSYLINDKDKDKKVKGTKNCVIKRQLKVENYEHYLEARQLEKIK